MRTGGHFARKRYGRGFSRDHLTPSINSNFINHSPARVPASGVLRMDMMAMVMSMLSMQAANTQTQVSTAIMKSNADAAKSEVQTLLGTPSQANLGTGVGGSIDISA
jgi:hypothetical protein